MEPDHWAIPVSLSCTAHVNRNDLEHSLYRIIGVSEKQLCDGCVRFFDHGAFCDPFEYRYPVCAVRKLCGARCGNADPVATARSVGVIILMDIDLRYFIPWYNEAMGAVIL